MGMGSPNQGGDFDGLGVQSVLAEINVTPLVDVMLVLLIIFMVTAPILTQGIEIDLPQAVAGNLSEPDKVLLLQIDDKQDLYLVVGSEQRKLDPDKLHETLPAILENRTDKRVFLEADKTVPYGFVVKVLNAAKEGGVIDVGLVTEPQAVDEDKVNP